jgi:hypothetical protein
MSAKHGVCDDGKARLAVSRSRYSSVAKLGAALDAGSVRQQVTQRRRRSRTQLGSPGRRDGGRSSSGWRCSGRRRGRGWPRDEGHGEARG